MNQSQFLRGNPQVVMTSTPDTLIRRSDLLGRLVLNHDTAEELGHVDQVWLDPQAHQVIGFLCRSGLFYHKKHGFTWSQIETIGNDSILVTPLGAVEPEPPDSTLTEPGQELWTDTGDRVGSLLDYRLHPETGDVIDYLFVFSGWRQLTDGVYCLSADAIISMSRKRVIVSETAIQNAELFEKGLSQGVAQMTEFFKDDYARTQQDLQALKHTPQVIADQLQAATQKAKARLSGTSESSQPQLTGGTDVDDVDASSASSALEVSSDQASDSPVSEQPNPHDRPASDAASNSQQ